MSGKPMHTCGAHCRTTGKPCKNRPMANGRCRMHGGKSTGRPPVTGRYTKAVLAQKSEWREVERQLVALIVETDEHVSAGASLGPTMT